MASMLLDKLESRATQAEELIISLKNQLEEMMKNAHAAHVEYNKQRLLKENGNLQDEIEIWKNKLVELEIKNGIKQISLPGEKVCYSEPAVASPSLKIPVTDEKLNISAKPSNKSEQFIEASMTSGGKKDKGAKQASKKSAIVDVKNKSTDEQPIDVGRLDFRIGRILSAKKHPDADALYVEEVDIGEEKNRTVVSGLVKHVPLEQMQNRLVMLLCNLKPAKMRGITSEAMVMCASTPDKVEILIPPVDSVPGDRVVCKGFERTPDKELNPKKKIFEQIAPDLKTSSELKAVYKDVPLEVPGKGFIFSKTLTNVQIK